MNQVKWQAKERDVSERGVTPSGLIFKNKAGVGFDVFPVVSGEALSLDLDLMDAGEPDTEPTEAQERGAVLQMF